MFNSSCGTTIILIFFAQVLSSGEVLEFDTPFHLLQDRNSLLSEMVRKTDAETAQKLRQIAVNAHTKNLI